MFCPLASAAVLPALWLVMPLSFLLALASFFESLLLVLGELVAHDENLEAQLVLEDAVEQLRVATRVAAVDDVVAAHDAGHAGPDGRDDLLGARRCWRSSR